MQIVDISKPLIIVVSHKGKDSEVVVAPEDAIYLDITGVEFEHRASGRRRFIPWSSVAEIYQALE